MDMSGTARQFLRRVRISADQAVMGRFAGSNPWRGERGAR